MDSKLTLKLDTEVIARAKQYAKRKKISLSRLIESYLDAISSDEVEVTKTTPLVERLSGVIDLPEDFDYRSERDDSIEKKHT